MGRGRLLGPNLIYYILSIESGSTPGNNLSLGVIASQYKGSTNKIVKAQQNRGKSSPDNGSPSNEGELCNNDRGMVGMSMKQQNKS